MFCFVLFCFVFFFCLNLWRRGSLPQRSWRLGAPPFCDEPFLRHRAPLSLLGLDVMSESHCTNPTGGCSFAQNIKKKIHLTLKMTSAQVVETSVTNNSSFQFRATLTRTITQYKLQILLGSNHLPYYPNSQNFPPF